MPTDMKESVDNFICYLEVTPYNGGNPLITAWILTKHTGPLSEIDSSNPMRGNTPQHLPALA